jgi:RNase P subunit RPR2
MTYTECSECEETIWLGDFQVIICQRGDKEEDTRTYCPRCAWIELTNMGKAGTPNERGES